MAQQTSSSWRSRRSSTEVPTPHVGTVASFDATRAIGTIVLDDGAEIEFHSTALSDRSRDVAVGAKVVIEIAATHGGTVHCREVVKI